MRREPARGDLADLQRRFGRTVLLLHLCGAGVGIALLVGVLVTDLTFQKATVRDNLLIETQTRSRFFGRELGLLRGELRRLGLRSEVNLLDEDLEPERILLRLTHEKSAFFNVGVAIVDKEGRSLSSTPPNFLPAGKDVSAQRWFVAATQARDVEISPVPPEAEHESLVLAVAPVVRNGEFSGVLVGGIDLARGFDPDTGSAESAVTVLAARDGAVVYPATPPPFTAQIGWKEAFVALTWQPFVSRVVLGERPYVLAGDPVLGTSLVYLAVEPEDQIDAPARSRLATRLVFGIAAALVPLGILVVVLRRTLQVFLVAQEAAARDERLRHIGEAANLIAHEIKNSLNGLQVGLELVTRVDASKKDKTVGAMKSEMNRLSEFTTRLLTFAKGVSPRPQPMELGRFVRRVVELFEEQAAEAGVTLAVDTPPEDIQLRADSSLLHVVVSNLVGNALDALAGYPGGRIDIDVRRSGAQAVVRVADNGPGVLPAVAASLFEPFVTAKPSGTGIGLTVSRKIALAHGGDLVFAPAERGATFLLTLPIRSS